MKTFFIDYSELYFCASSNTSLPDRWSGKFVQIRKGGAEYLVFSPAALTAYHADIVERFCRDWEIDGAYNVEKKRFDIHDAAWVVVGGGKFELDRQEKRLRLYDNSMAYGKFDSRGLRGKILQVEMLKDYEVQMG